MKASKPLVLTMGDPAGIGGEITAKAWRALAGSGPQFAIVADPFWVGGLVTAAVLARLKLLTGGRWLWTRTIGSTVVGQAADSLLFYPLAFYGLPDWPPAALGAVMVSQFVLKVSWETVLTPVTYLVVGWLKRREGLDVFDRGTRFSPFAAAL